VTDWERLIDAAPLFGCDIVSGFAGRIPGRPVPAKFALAEINGDAICFDLEENPGK
jgi:sugar phosphate isomerase/epimerase